MEKKKIVCLCIIAVIIVAIISYFIGYKRAYDDFEKNLDIHKVSYQTFYATITDIRDTNFTIDNIALTVKGLDINDINFRGNFEFIITEATELEWRHTKINADELEVGDNISIIFTGSIQETEPAEINDVIKIQLLDDEK